MKLIFEKREIFQGNSKYFLLRNKTAFNFCCTRDPNNLSKVNRVLIAYGSLQIVVNFKLCCLDRLVLEFVLRKVFQMLQYLDFLNIFYHFLSLFAHSC